MLWNSYTFLKFLSSIKEKGKIIAFTSHVLICLMLLFGTAKETHAQNLLEEIAAHIELKFPSDIKGDYLDKQEKWVAYIHAAYPVGDLGITIAVDLTDYLGITAEGQLGWVTVWAGITGSSGFGFPIGFGAQKRAFDKFEVADKPTDLFNCSVGASIPTLEFNRFEVSSSEGVKEFMVTFNPTEFKFDVGVGCELQALMFEMKRHKLNEIILNALCPGITAEIFCSILTSRLLPDGSLDNSLFPYRLATNSDNPFTAFVHDISGDKLVLDEWGEISVKVLVTESNYYTLEVWSAGMLGSPQPEWEWANRIAGPVWIEAGENHEFFLYVTPEDTSGDFNFRVYQTTFWGSILVEEQEYTLNAVLHSVDNTRPTVINHRHGSSPDTNIFVVFSEEMEALTFTNTTIEVEVSSGTHETTFNYNSSTNELTIDPVENFSFGETVSVLITKYVQDIYGNELENPYQFSFNIQDEPIQPPTRINIINLTLDPATVDPYGTFEVRGTAQYDNSQPVGEGTALIEISGGNTYTWPVSGGSFARDCQAPGNTGTSEISRTVTVTVSDGVVTEAEESSTLYIRGQGGISYNLITNVVYDYEGDNTHVNWWSKDAFTSFDNVVNLMAVFENMSGNEWLDLTWRLLDRNGDSWTDLDWDDAVHLSWGWGWACWGWLINGESWADYPGRYGIEFHVNGDRKATHFFVLGWDFSEHKMCKSIDDDPDGEYLPGGVTNVFSTEDNWAIGWHNFEMVAQTIEVKGEFYDPAGNPHTEDTWYTQHTLEFGLQEHWWYDWYRHGMYLGIKNGSAKYKCGRWMVKFYVKRPVSGTWEHKYTEYFRIEEGTAPTISSISTLPESPIETQSITLVASVMDNNHLDRIELHWQENGGSVQTQPWSSIDAGSRNVSHSIGSKSSGTIITYWAEAWDESGNRTESEHRSVTVGYEIVSTPDRPSGPGFLKAGQSGTYSTGGSSSNLDNSVDYMFDWNDSSQSSWNGASQGKSWSADGYYFVKAKAHSQANTSCESNWSNSLMVTVDSVAPTVEITTNGGNTFATYQKQIVLEGNVDDPEPSSGPASTAINTGDLNEGTFSDWRFTIDLSPGPNALTVACTDNAGNEAIDTITIDYIPPEPDMSVSPPSHDFGDVAVASFSEQVVTVSNDGNGTLHATGSSIAGDNSDQFSIEGGEGSFDLQPGDEHNITVKFSPTSTGIKNAILRILSDDPDENPKDVTLIGNGLAFDYYIAPPPTGNDENAGIIPSAPFATIQRAIDVAVGSETNPITIAVAAGTYTENVVMDNWESLEGGWNSNFSQRWDFDSNGLESTADYETIIDGEGSGTCITLENINESVIIDGLKIQNGNASEGGGVFNGHSSPTINNCIFYGNSGGNGGAISNDHSSPTITRCTFRRNRGGTGTGGNGGGIYNKYSSPIISNCVFYKNSADNFGGGIQNYYYSSPTITNCIFYGNAAGQLLGGGAIDNNISCSPVITNCILWGNIAQSFPEVRDSNSSSSIITYCDIDLEGYEGINGNIRQDPLFVDSANGDLHLQQVSPCIDAGDPVSDYSNEPEPNGGRINIGAYGGTSEATTTPIDSDNDGLPDYLENEGCTDPYSTDSDNDGIQDAVEDANRNGTVDPGETDPCENDTDDDGIQDGVEDANYNGAVDTGETDPRNPDTDGDGIQDGTELGYTLDDIGSDTEVSIFQPDLDPSTTTDALNPDTDGDGLTDGEEDKNYNGRTDPGETDANSVDYSVDRFVSKLGSDDLGDGTENNPWLTIQHAINEVHGSAANPLTIYVAAGTYYEHDIVMKEGVRLIGEAASTTTIHGGGNGHVLILNNLSHVQITGFTVTGNRNQGYAAIYCEHSTPVIRNNIILNNPDPGIRCNDGSDAVIKHNILVNNEVGVVCNNSSPLILNNTFYDNHQSVANYSMGIPVVSNNIFASNYIGIYRGGTVPSPILRYNNVWNSQYADYLDVTPGPTDISVDPHFVNVYARNFHLQPDSLCIDAGDPVEILTADYIGGVEIEVNSVTAVSPGDTIWITDGMNTESDEVVGTTATTVTVASGFTNSYLVEDGAYMYTESSAFSGEPEPNGRRINMGGYGGTSEATTSPVIDSDNDGLPDYLEDASCTDPHNPDSDHDGLSDGVEDANQNGVVDPGETDPCDADTDDDGISDGVEDTNHNGAVDTGETDPRNPDTDGDGIQDGTELGFALDNIGTDTDTNIFQADLDPSTTTDPINPDTDGDGLTDGEEDSNYNGRTDPGETDATTTGLYNGDFEIIDPSDSSNPDGWTLEVGGRDNPDWGLHKDVLDNYYYSGSRSIHFRLIGYSDLHCYGIIKSPLIDTVEGDLVWYQSQKTGFDASDVEYTIKFYDGDDNLVSSNLYYTDTTTSQAGPGCTGFLGDSDMSPPAVMAGNGGPAFGGGNWYKFSNDIPDIDTDKFRFEIHIYQWEAPNKSGDGDACGSAYYGGFDNFHIEPDSPEIVLTQLTTDPANDYNPSWSPDGNDIMFTRLGSPKELIKLSVSDLSETQLTSYSCSLQWGHYSPDGTQVVYTKDNCNGWYDVYVMNSDGSSDHCITCGYSGMNDRVIWHPVSNKIIYENAPDCCNRYPWDLISINPDGSGKTELVFDVLLLGAPQAMSPDESMILYSTETYRDSHIGWMYINDLNTGAVVDLGRGLFSRQSQSWQSQIFSPDGLKTVYHSDEDGNWNIYTINIDGTEKTQLTTDTSDDRSTYFSPDGSKIVFQSERSGNNDIWVMNADGSNKVQLTTDTSDDIGPSWNPSGDKIVFMSDRSGNYDIWMITLGSASIPLYDTPIGTDVRIEIAEEDMAITFDQVTEGGETWVAVLSSGPAPPSGFNLSGDYYDITTTASYTGDITVCVNYDESQVDNEMHLELFHYEDGDWVEVSNSLDTDTNIICGTVTSLSPFMVAECSAVPGDLDGDGDVDRDDVNIIKVYCNQPASVCPECDIDGDGTITVLDARKLMLMCTCPMCICE